MRVTCVESMLSKRTSEPYWLFDDLLCPPIAHALLRAGRRHEGMSIACRVPPAFIARGFCMFFFFFLSIPSILFLPYFSSSLPVVTQTWGHMAGPPPPSSLRYVPSTFMCAVLGPALPVACLSGCWPGARPGSEVWNSLYYTVREFPFTTCQLVDDDCEVDFNTVTSPSVSGGGGGRGLSLCTMASVCSIPLKYVQ